MPKVYKDEKMVAIKLRQQGKSYREIQKETGVRSRSTLTEWFKELKLSPAIQKIIDERKARTEKNVLIWSKARSERIKKENPVIIAQGIKEIGAISKRDLMFIGAALYWAEGSLRFSKQGYHIFRFSNSSPQMVKVFLVFLRRCLSISDADMRPFIHIHPNISADKAISFWSEVTKLSKQNFKTYDAISSASKLKRPAHFLPHVTFQLSINGRKNFYKIRGYIDGIIKSLE